MTDMPPVTHEILADMAEQYAQACLNRKSIEAAMRAQFMEVVSHYRVFMAEAVAAERNCRDTMHDAVSSAPELFARPRTRKVHGIEYGWRTGKPSIQIPDEAKTIGLIRKLLPEGQQVLLIRTKETVEKRAVLDLTAADLRRLAILQTPAEDTVVCRPIDDDTDRLVAALLADAESAAADPAQPDQEAA